MSSNIVDRYGSQNGAEVDVYSESGPYRAFGISRKAFGGEPLIDFISRGGDHHALTYGHLYDVTFNPSKGVVLQFTDHLVTLEGRLLKECYDQLLRQRVVWIAEASDAIRKTAPEDKPLITSLTIASKREQILH